MLAVYGPMCGCVVHCVEENSQHIERIRNVENTEPQYVTTTVALAKYSELPEDGSMVNRNMSEPMTDF
jgi:hypothetical protein